VSHQVLANQLGASESYLPKVITHLTKQGLLTTQRGPFGGTRLARDPKDISLLEVVQACEGATAMAFKPSASGQTGVLCPLHQAMLEIEHLVNQTLAQWTIADMQADSRSSGVNCASRTPCFMRQVWEAARKIPHDAP
jgi:Rrf2 family protein